MTWIESHQSLRMHPKTQRLARLLGVTIPDAIGRLHLLWWWALDYAPKGDLSNYVVEDIAEAMMWTEEADRLIQALLAAGFLDAQPVLSIHHWPDYSGRILDRRELNAARQARWRERHSLAQSVTATVLPPSDPPLLRNTHVTVTNALRTGTTGQTGPNRPDLPNHKGASFASQTIGKRDQIASHDAPPNGGISSVTLLEKYGERLKVPKANAAGVLGEAFQELFARTADFPRLGKLAKQYQSGETLRAMFKALPEWRGFDDPLDLVQKILSSKANGSIGKANGRAVDDSEFNVSHGHNDYDDDDLTAHNARVLAQAESERKQGKNANRQ